jgi:class 3 adenylate cyclase
MTAEVPKSGVSSSTAGSNWNAYSVAAKRVLALTLPFLVALLLMGLPLAVWLDLRHLTEAALRRQAIDFNSLITSVRDYYATNVVGRVLATAGSTQVTNNYKAIPGAIPIPATLSLELGQVISQQQKNINYRFVSDFPFQNRVPHVLDEFERDSLSKLRADPHQLITDLSNSIFSDRIRLIAPVVMGPACVSCHNTHPESPRRDWKVGDVRGIQEISVTQPIAINIFSFKYLLIYFALVAATGLVFIVIQRRQATLIRFMNKELETKNKFLASLSSKISRYLSPQVYNSIFSGRKDVTIQTERKKLTIFFSDIVDFTATTEQLQPEQITRLLNEYFTEMSTIALSYGGTISRFAGDGMLIFFGDPETRGQVEDAVDCMRMAFDMQGGIAELNAKWRNEGIEHPFRVRMGINTGFCDVGNFGSINRMDYTIIGVEANLAARLQSIAEPGQIVVSYETYALVRHIVVAHPLPPIAMKGIGREVVPYAIEGVLDIKGAKVEIFSEHLVGADFYIDPTRIGADTAERLRNVLQQAIAALEKHRDEARGSMSALGH